MLKKRNQKGFTLIEIIAVLVILGILAAVAIPKYMNLQSDARNKAIGGAVAALQSTATQLYSKALLNGSTSGNDWVLASATYNVGDFWGTIVGAQQTVVKVTGASPDAGNYSDVIGTDNATKTFNMW